MISARYRPRRAGLSLGEMMAGLAILLILGAMLLPTFRNTERDTKVQAATDLIRTKIADARAAAIEQSMPYRLSISPDGRSIAVEPDDLNSLQFGQADETRPPLTAEAELPKDVTVVPIPTNDEPPLPDSRGWNRVATFLPDATCREDLAILEVRQTGIYTIQIRIRGLTGGTSVTKGPVARGNQ